MNNLPKTIVDVRTPGEFMGGHVEGSINIPLNQIKYSIDALKSMPQPIILCCASGARSAYAKTLLSSHGINCQDGGSWLSVNYHFQQMQS